MSQPRTHEATFLGIKAQAGDNSTIRYLMPMVTDAQGYQPHLKVYLNNATVSSSLNDIHLLTMESCEVSRQELPTSILQSYVSLDFGQIAFSTEMGILGLSTMSVYTGIQAPYPSRLALKEEQFDRTVDRTVTGHPLYQTIATSTVLQCRPYDPCMM